MKNWLTCNKFCPSSVSNEECQRLLCPACRALHQGDCTNCVDYAICLNIDNLPNTPDKQPCKLFCRGKCGVTERDVAWKFILCDECSPPETADCSICQTKNIPKGLYGSSLSCPYQQ